MFILEIGATSDSGSKEPESDALQTGVLREGCAGGPTGTAWYDSSNDPGYGRGRRFEHEETPYMTKILSRKDK